MKKNSLRFATYYFSRSRYRLSKLKNIHRDKRAFIIGTGPSLHIHDLDLLKNEVTFGCNKIYLAFIRTDWRPTYYTVTDRLVAQNNKDEIDKLSLTKIFSSDAKPFFNKFNDIIWLNELKSPKIKGQSKFHFSTDALRGTFGGYTVIYTQLQLAYFMGIKEVYLIGVDYDYTESKHTGDKTSAGELILESGGELNHFHPDYRPEGELWTIPKLDYQYKAFQVAKKAFDKDNRMIYNASRQTKLDVFHKINFDSVI